MSSKKPDTEEMNAKQKVRVAKSSRKDRTGIPSITPLEAINFVKKAHEAIGDDLTSFKRMATAMGMKEAYAKKALGILAEPYGVIRQPDPRGGWEITDIGKRVALDDKDAILHVLRRVDILAQVHDAVKDKRVDKSYIEEFINKKRLNINATNVAQKYIEVINYIASVKEESTKSSAYSGTSEEWLKIMQLKYALDPPSDKEISELAKNLGDVLSKHSDHAVKVLAEKITDNADNADYLRLLVHSVEAIIGGKDSHSRKNK